MFKILSIDETEKTARRVSFGSNEDNKKKTDGTELAIMRTKH